MSGNSGEAEEQTDTKEIPEEFFPTTATKEERRKRFFELKAAKEKAQRHLESLTAKKRGKEEEVICSS